MYVTEKNIPLAAQKPLLFGERKTESKKLKPVGYGSSMTGEQKCLK